MGDTKGHRLRSVEEPPERPSRRSILAATVLEPGLEHTSRTANRIREEIGIAAHRYVLVLADGSVAELVENVRIAVLRAITRAQESHGRVEVRETTTRHLLCWAERGTLYAVGGASASTPDAVVHAERRRLGTR